MFLIVEGGDLVGKSTYVKNLGDNLDVKICYGSDHRGDVKAALDHILEMEQKYPDKFIVFDRSPIISEMIYGKPPESGEEYVVNTLGEALLRKVLSHTVILTVPPAILAKRYAERGDDEVNLEEAIEYNGKYIALAEKWGISVSTVIQDIRKPEDIALEAPKTAFKTDLDEYASKVLVNMKSFDNATVEQLYWLMGFAEEAHEVQHIVKHIIFKTGKLKDDPGLYKVSLDAKRLELMDEMGDVLFYFVKLCRDYNLDIKEIMNYNIEKLTDRYGK